MVLVAQLTVIASPALALGRVTMPITHRPGSLRQENKKHKGNGHQSKRASKSALGAGRVPSGRACPKSGVKRAAEGRKQNRANHAMQMRKKKREETWLRKRLGSDDGPPKLCAWVSLSAIANPDVIQQRMLDGCARSSEPSTGFGMVSAAFKQFKQRMTLLTPDRNVVSVLEFAKVADLLLVVLPVEQGADAAVDEVRFRYHIGSTNARNTVRSTVFDIWTCVLYSSTSNDPVDLVKGLV